MGALVIRIIATEYPKDICKSVTCNKCNYYRCRSNMQLEKKEGLYTLRKVCPKCYFFHQAVEACLPWSIHHDERFFCFKICHLPFLIAHHSFPISHSFNRHFAYSLLPSLQVSCKTAGNSSLEPTEPFSRLSLNHGKYTTDIKLSGDRTKAILILTHAALQALARFHVP